MSPRSNVRSLPLVLLLSLSNTTAAAADDPQTFFTGWGVGVALVRPSKQVVIDASIAPDGTVSLDDSSRFQTKFILARHWYFESDNKELKGKCAVTVAGACLGVMVNAGVGTNQIIDLIGGGVILGWGDPSKEKTPQARDHNLGIGAGRLFRHKMLAAGFEPGRPAPAGATQVRYRYSDASAWYIFYTHAFR